MTNVSFLRIWSHLLKKSVMENFIFLQWYFTGLHLTVLTAVNSKKQTCSLVTNNHASFHLWWKESLVKHLKVSKYYDHDCLQNFILLFMSLSTVQIVTNIHVFVVVYFIFLKKHLRLNLKGLQYLIGPQWKDLKNS